MRAIKTENNMTSNFIPQEIGLNKETDLLIYQSKEGACGVDLPQVPNSKIRTGQQKREKLD